MTSLPLSHAIPRVRDDSESLLDGGRGCGSVAGEDVGQVFGWRRGDDLPIRDGASGLLDVKSLGLDAQLSGRIGQTQVKNLAKSPNYGVEILLGIL